MIDNLSIYHIKKKSDNNAPSALSVLSSQFEGWVLFETCQRKIYISMLPQNTLNAKSDNRMLSGEAAYSALLRVLCGLESRIVGETEVFGQFKVFIKGERSNLPFWFNRFLRIAQNLIVDVKNIRHTFLNSTGHRSYGALTKLYLDDCTHLAIIGAGQLARKTLPYFNIDTCRVSMFLRNPVKARCLPPRLLENVKVYSLAGAAKSQEFQGLIIAAPLSSREIEKWLKGLQNMPLIVVDLRDQTADRRLEVEARLVTLDDLFAEIEKTSQIFVNQIEDAKRHIYLLTRERFSARYFRPFGWEDICA